MYIDLFSVKENVVETVETRSVDVDDSECGAVEKFGAF